MIGLSGTAIFWLMTIGLLTGLIFGLVVKNEGVTVMANIFWGIFASLLIGAIGSALGFGDSLLYSFIYIIAFLFLVNVFHQHHEEDIHGDIDQHIHISKSGPTE